MQPKYIYCFDDVTHFQNKIQGYLFLSKTCNKIVLQININVH